MPEVGEERERISCMTKNASSEATRRSQASMRATPPPTQQPWITARVGTGQLSIASTVPWRVPASTCAPPPPLALADATWASSPRSSPEQKPSPSPRSTTARTPGLRARSPNASPSTRQTSASSGLRCSGRLRVTVSTPRSSSSMRAEAVMAGSSETGCGQACPSGTGLPAAQAQARVAGSRETRPRSAVRSRSVFWLKTAKTSSWVTGRISAEPSRPQS